MDKHLNKYISKRYRHWLDYAKFQSNNGGIPSCAEDVLQEVLLQILSKGNEFVLDLYNIKKQGITALDFYVLNVIKTNAISETGRFKNLYKLRRNQINNNVDCSTVFEEIEKIKDEVYIDIPSDNDLILEKKHLLREAFKNVESKLNSLDSQ